MLVPLGAMTLQIRFDWLCGAENTEDLVESLSVQETWSAASLCKEEKNKKENFRLSC